MHHKKSHSRDHEEMHHEHKKKHHEHHEKDKHHKKHTALKAKIASHAHKK